MEQYATMVSELSQKLVDILASELGQKSEFFKEKCVASTCYLRLNRYPACPIFPEMFGIMPHTDSDFITVLHQDQIGGLQLVKDGSWFAVKPNPQALVINIGDLFQVYLRSHSSKTAIKMRIENHRFANSLISLDISRVL